MPNHDQAQKNLLDDIKTLFEGITNFGLCATLAIGLQYLQEPMINAGIAFGWRAFINILAFGMTCFLTSMAIIWIVMSFKTEPSCKIFHYSSLIFLGLVTLIIMGTLIFSSLENVSFNIY